MGFREVLPANCPPPEAHDGPCDTVFRFVPSATPTANDFASKAALSVPIPSGVCPCRWSSCSLFENLSALGKKRKLIKMFRKRYPFVAKLKILAKSGFLLHTGPHIDFWMYDSFDPLAAIQEVKALQDA